MRVVSKIALLAAYTCICVAVTVYFHRIYMHKNEGTFLGVATAIDGSLLHGLKDVSMAERQQRIEDGQKVMFWLLQELYFSGDKYGYHYNSTEFEALVLDIYRREKNFVFEEARKTKGAVPSYYYRHLKSFAGAIPLVETGVNGHSFADFEMLVLAMRELQEVDANGFHTFVAENQASRYVQEAVERISAKPHSEDERNRGRN